MKIKLDKSIPLIHPVPITVIGTMNHDKPNYTTIGDIAVAGIDPALIMISINKNHAAMKHIDLGKAFSVNVVIKSMLSKVDYAGMYSSRTTDKSDLFESDIIENIPIIKNSPVALLVKEEKRITIKQRVILVCHVLGTYLEEELLCCDKLDLSDLSTVMYGLDNGYYLSGSQIGRGYQEGCNYKEE